MHPAPLTVDKRSNLSTRCFLRFQRVPVGRSKDSAARRKSASRGFLCHPALGVVWSVTLSGIVHAPTFQTGPRNQQLEVARRPSSPVVQVRVAGVATAVEVNVHGVGGTRWGVHGKVVSLGEESSVYSALSSQGNYLSVHSPTGVTHAMHVYFYNSGDPGDASLYNWATASSDHFELLVPRTGQEGGSVDDSTPCTGPDKTSSAGWQRNPLLTGKAMRLTRKHY